MCRLKKLFILLLCIMGIILTAVGAISIFKATDISTVNIIGGADKPTEEFIFRQEIIPSVIKIITGIAIIPAAIILSVKIKHRKGK